MNALKLLPILVLGLVLSGCASFGNNVEKANELQSTVVSKDRLVYPNLPNLEVPTVSLVAFEWSHPQDADGEDVLNGNANRCLAPEDWQTFQINHVRTKEYIVRLLSRIRIVNDQRSNWRDLNNKQNTPPTNLLKNVQSEE